LYATESLWSRHGLVKSEFLRMYKHSINEKGRFTLPYLH